VRRALHTRDTGVQERLVLAGVQVPPHPLVGMIMPRCGLVTLGTRL
jgi:hypothetical protein